MKDCTLEDAILQAKGEHVPTQEKIELQDEQQLENLDVVDDIEQPVFNEGIIFFLFFHFYTFCFLFNFFNFFLFFFSFQNTKPLVDTQDDLPAESEQTQENDSQESTDKTNADGKQQ